ncbi:DNA oxidative demethylase ALKBH2-like [Gigantopelta aegis]|uniref:DNA oxidative demethylase ALKBH2-like n=1 Tax=Gigantopelta aegis TaxID=1735272 RepID=UPI001B8890AB|nr:DNA oxidative demethylase ALKBH2-like [Gigantopelta aegis]
MSDCTTSDSVTTCKRKRNTDNDRSQEDPKVAKCDPVHPHNRSNVKWETIRAENLACDMVAMYGKTEADALLEECEKTLTYNSGQLSKIRVFGKWHSIPRKQVAHGDPGLSYSFSGTTVPAYPWIPLLLRIRDKITDLTGYNFNFVLINRYQDGNDYIGEHKDDEVDLIAGHPIASLSLGQARDFVFRHQDTRGKKASRCVDPVTIELQHGTLLMMKYPTNSYWYHSVPRRKKLTGVRINMTFRKMDPSKCKKIEQHNLS